MALAVKLFLSHILGDFVLQSDKWVQNKQEKKLKSPYLYGHILLHMLLVQLLVGDWQITGIVVVTHAVIDILKLLLQKDGNRRLLFFVDQSLHVLVIIALVFYSTDETNSEAVLNWIERNLHFITGAIFLTTPASVIIKTVISRWEPGPAPDSEADSDDSLQKAGASIGILERLFVFAFVLTGHWEAIGFLIAAKSVFRFGDLKDSHDRKLTEYILIGTLLSVGTALVIGLLVTSYSGL